MHLSAELGYVAIVFALFVVPRALQRYGVPAAITSLVLGATTGLGTGLLREDATIHLLSTFGIVSLFLFAGLEVDTRELRENAAILAQHLAVRALMLVATAVAAQRILQLDPRVATLLALGLVTPSTGFILDSLGQFGLAPRERRWIKAKAIATEILALLVLFGTLQSTSAPRLALSTGVLLAMVALLPLAFRAFARHVVPFAPRSEFGFLVMIAVSCAYVTRELGVYYLVGAFVVGMTAQRFRERLPALASDEMVHAVAMFASFFVPFYFFHAGLTVHAEDLDLRALTFGLAFLAVATPLRLGTVLLHRRFALQERGAAGLRIGVALLPTLVFGLVIAEILEERFQASPEIVGGLIFYTLGTTLLPAVILRRRLPDVVEPRVSDRPASEAGEGPGEA